LSTLWICFWNISKLHVSSTTQLQGSTPIAAPAVAAAAAAAAFVRKQQWQTVIIREHNIAAALHCKCMQWLV